MEDHQHLSQPNSQPQKALSTRTDGARDAAYRSSIGIKVPEGEESAQPLPPESTAQRALFQRTPPGTSPDRRRRLGGILISIGLLLLLVGMVLASVTGYQAISADYHSEMAVAQNGLQRLHNALDLLKTLQGNPLNAPAVSQASREFSAASSSFTQVYETLHGLPPILASLPVYGSRLGGALRLLPIAIEVAQAGVAGCAMLNILIPRLKNPLTSANGGLTVADMTLLNRDYTQARQTLNLMISQIKQVQPSDLQLDPRLSGMMASFEKVLPSLQAWLTDADNVMALAPSLLGIGAPANYLIELVDSTELRPTGGFIGNYGIANVSGGRLLSAHITDVYLFDNAYEATGKHTPYPPQLSWFQLARQSWDFRDSNFEADFPTSARYSEMNYQREGGNIPFQGVISITPALIERALTVTGPIFVPRYNEYITAQNLVERIHFHQLGAGRQGDDVPSSDGHSSVRKHFTELLSEQFLARLHTLSPANTAKLLQVLLNSLHTKDLQVYLNAAPAENVLAQLHIDGSIHASPGDGLFVVDANISPSKANAYITDTLKDTVTLDLAGNAVHATTLTYHWAINGPVYGAQVYHDYVRVYLPPGSDLIMQTGWRPWSTASSFNREVVSGMIYLTYSHTDTITLIWMVPRSARLSGSTWHYEYEIQRQAGAQWSIQVQIHLPLCDIITSTTGGLTSSDKKIASISQNLAEDTPTAITYKNTCS